MKQIQVTRLAKCAIDYMPNATALQMVEITVDFFGLKQTNRYDTKIMADGKQYVINGDGWIKDGFEITDL